MLLVLFVIALGVLLVFQALGLLLGTFHQCLLFPHLSRQTLNDICNGDQIEEPLRRVKKPGTLETVTKSPNQG